jgi:hypothetical protein
MLGIAGCSQPSGSEHLRFPQWTSLLIGPGTRSVLAMAWLVEATQWWIVAWMRMKYAEAIRLSWSFVQFSHETTKPKQNWYRKWLAFKCFQGRSLVSLYLVVELKFQQEITPSSCWPNKPSCGRRLTCKQHATRDSLRAFVWCVWKLEPQNSIPSNIYYNYHLVANPPSFDTSNSQQIVGYPHYMSIMYIYMSHKMIASFSETRISSINWSMKTIENPTFCIENHGQSYVFIGKPLFFQRPKLAQAPPWILESYHAFGCC